MSDYIPNSVTDKTYNIIERDKVERNRKKIEDSKERWREIEGD